MAAKKKTFFICSSQLGALNLQGALLLKLNESLAIILYKNKTKFKASPYWESDAENQ